MSKFDVPKPWIVDDAEAFKTPCGYRFPFVALDPTPGGSNLGRIEWCVELVPARKAKGRKAIEAIALWARQTRDERYTGKVFYLPCFTEAITTNCERDDFFKFVWHQGFCNHHGLLISTAYADNAHVALIVEVMSGISNDIYFERSDD